MSASAPVATAPKIGRGLPQSLQALLAFLGLVASSPLWLLGGIAMALTSPGPPLFRQERVGRGGRGFVLLKLRTMSHGGGGVGFTARDDPRVTRVGALLRRTKFDELPELWNVVRGEMALVGPRPEVPKYVDLRSPLWQAVLRVRPGLTDPMAIHLRDEEGLLSEAGSDRERTYLEVLQPYKLRGHLAYLERRTWVSDLAVLTRTALAVLLPSTAAPPTWNEIRQSAGASDGGAEAGSPGDSR